VDDAPSLPFRRLAGIAPLPLLFAFLSFLALIAPFCALHAQSPERPLTIQEVITLPEPPAGTGGVGIPVTVRALLTYYEPGHRMAFLQDATGVIYLHVVSATDVSVGDLVDVRGFVDPGLKGRSIRGATFDRNPELRRIGRGKFPEPIPCESIEKLREHQTPAWSSLNIAVRAVTLEGDRARLDCQGGGGVPIYIAGIASHARLPAHLLDMSVKVHGVTAWTTISETPLILQQQFLVPDIRHVIIPPQEMERLFALEETLNTELRWLPDRVGSGRRYRIRDGGVTWVKPGEGFFMQQGTVPAWVSCTLPELPAIYQYVDCAGIASSYQGTGVLENAVWKPAQAQGIDITPEVMHPSIMREDLMHGRYVVLDGEVVEHYYGPTEDLTILAVGGETVLCHLSSAISERTQRQIIKGSRVQVNGAWINRPGPAFNTEGTQGAFHLLMRSPEDLTIIAAPPFWDMRRVLYMLAGVVAVMLLALAWLITLRRRVKEQAETIRETVAKQAVEEERVRIARDWHDTFEQHFAGLTMLLDGASSTLPANTPMWKVIKQATRMADRSRSEARQAIWDLRSSGLNSHDSFCSELEESLRLIWPKDASAQLSFTCQGDTANLTRSTALHLLRIASEAVTNALKHSGSNRILVHCQCEGERLRVSIRDEGCGVAASQLQNASAHGHFGVLGMRERALRIDGLFEVLSPPPGHPVGTLITVSIPLSQHGK
jgi:signal transduction histidine kinase